MLYLILALVALGLISAIFGIISHRKGEDEEPLQEGVSCNTCNGENSKCEQECMMEAATLGGIQQKMIETLGELVQVLPSSHMPAEA